MSSIDWAVVIAFIVVLFVISLYTRSLVRSAADFVAANRCAGRYILTAASAMAGVLRKN
jgi:SSS family solute:Na+ symporter